jgi:DedD protein
MRTTYEEEEEDLAPLPTQPDRELTLSSTTLLAIFFGLVLICGLFFGLGYTLGRRSSETPNSANPAQAASTAPDPQTSLPPSDLRPKPSAAAQPTVVAPATNAPLPDDTQSPDAVSVTPAPEDKSAAVKPATKTPDSPAPPPKPTVQPALPSTAQPTPPTTPGVMVQIAAVTNSADADVLVKALQKHGYSVTVRHDPSDNFLHVQVGPFATRAEANTMRQKLLSDGYNAIIK